MTIFGLKPGTAYYLRCFSKDASDHAISGELSFTTKGVAGASTGEPGGSGGQAGAGAGAGTGAGNTGGRGGVLEKEHLQRVRNRGFRRTRQGAGAGAENLLASVGGFPANLCRIILALLIILTIWHLVEVMRMRKKAKRKDYYCQLSSLFLLSCP